ncbi:Alpha-L-arabinofuranosidase 1 [Hordeum vulgare]|nr:Alpha-L-arabinofuranosidase 1 [Hordeum vulgare]
MVRDVSRAIQKLGTLASRKELDQASTRTRETSSLSGFVWSLSVWMWELLPVGRPVLRNPDNPNPYPYEGLHDVDPYRRPTVAYHWDRVSVYTGSSHVRYKCYVNELDTLTAEQLVLLLLVFWRPYEKDREYDLNKMCTRDNNIWRFRSPMICFYAVEHHFVDRVARQFEKRQGIPIEENKSVQSKEQSGYIRLGEQTPSLDSIVESER